MSQTIEATITKQMLRPQIAIIKYEPQVFHLRIVTVSMLGSIESFF